MATYTIDALGNIIHDVEDELHRKITATVVRKEVEQRLRIKIPKDMYKRCWISIWKRRYKM